MNDAPAAIDWSRGVPLMAGPYFLGLYQPSPETRDFWEGVARREILLKWCPHCEMAMHPKRIVCTTCGSSELGSRRASGRATIYSFSVVHRAPSAAFAAALPYAVGVVRLEEGVHLFTRLFPPTGVLAIDAPVRADFRILELGNLLPVFTMEAP
jgi:uncharacterized protein